MTLERSTDTTTRSPQLDVTAVRPPDVDSYHAEQPDVTQTSHTDFHYSHGIRHTNHTWSPALCGSTNFNTEYAEFHRNVESANTNSNSNTNASRIHSGTATNADHT